MSSNDDKEAQGAKIAQLEAHLDFQQERYDSKIMELKQKNADLEQKNSDLEEEKRLLEGRAPRHAVSPGSSDPALQAEILRLRQQVETKDGQMSHLCALLRNCQSSLTAIRQGFIAINLGFHETTEDLSTVVQDIDTVLEDQTAWKELQSRPRSPVANNATGPSQPSQSVLKSVKMKADSEAGPPQPSQPALKPEKIPTGAAAGPPQPSQPALKPEKVPTGAAAGPPQPSQPALKPDKVATTTDSASKTSSTPDYAQALKTPAKKLPRLPKAKVPLDQSPLFAPRPGTHAVKEKAADQARSETERPKISQKPNRASTRGGPAQGTARGRGNRRGRGDSKSNRGSESTHVTSPSSPEKRVESRDTNVTAGSDQPPKKPEAESSVTTPATQAERDTLIDKDKKLASDPSSAPTARRRRRKSITEAQLASLLYFGYPIPSEPDTDDEEEVQPKGVAPSIQDTPASPAPGDVEDGPESPHGINDSHGGTEPGSAVAANIKPPQTRQTQPAIPLKKMSPDPTSGGLGDDQTATKESGTQGSRPPQAQSDVGPITGSITASGPGKAEPSHGPPMTPEVNTETLGTAQSLTSGGNPSQADSPKPLGARDSTKSSQEITSPVERDVTPDQPILDTAPPETASTDPAPVGFQFPYDGRRFPGAPGKVKFSNGFNPYTQAGLKATPGPDPELEALINQSDDDMKSFHLPQPHQWPAMPFQRTPGLKWDDEPLSEPPLPALRAPVGPQESKAMPWHNFEQQEGAENERKAAEWKKRGGSNKFKLPDRIFNENWRQVDVQSGSRAIVGVAKEKRVVLGEGEKGKEVSAAEKPGSST